MIFNWLQWISRRKFSQNGSTFGWECFFDRILQLIWVALITFSTEWPLSWNGNIEFFFFYRISGPIFQTLMNVRRRQQSVVNVESVLIHPGDIIVWKWKRQQLSELTVIWFERFTLIAFFIYGLLRPTTNPFQNPKKKLNCAKGFKQYFDKCVGECMDWNEAFPVAPSLTPSFFADIDECSTDRSSCDSTQNCINHPGTFECECKNGFIMDKLVNACIGKGFNAKGQNQHQN